MSSSLGEGTMALWVLLVKAPKRKKPGIIEALNDENLSSYHYFDTFIHLYYFFIGGKSGKTSYLLISFKSST